MSAATDLSELGARMHGSWSPGYELPVKGSKA